MLRILVTGKPPARGGGGIPQRIMISSRSPAPLRTTGRRIVRKDPWHRRQITDVPVDHPEQGDDRGLVRGDRIALAISTALSPLNALALRAANSAF